MLQARSHPASWVVIASILCFAFAAASYWMPLYYDVSWQPGYSRAPVMVPWIPTAIIAILSAALLSRSQSLRATLSIIAAGGAVALIGLVEFRTLMVPPIHMGPGYLLLLGSYTLAVAIIRFA